LICVSPCPSTISSRLSRTTPRGSPRRPSARASSPRVSCLALHPTPNQSSTTFTHEVPFHHGVQSNKGIWCVGIGC
jgi:hypothetical protein